MIIYDLVCDAEHEFEGWFKNADDMHRQKQQGLLSCPYCDSQQVSKRVSAAKLTKKSNSGPAMQQEVALGGDQSADDYKNMQQMLGKVYEYIDKNFIDVGNRFAEEAISIHRGEKDPANLRGTVSTSELQMLSEQGVNAVPLPPRPVDKKKIN